MKMLTIILTILLSGCTYASGYYNSGYPYYYYGPDTRYYSNFGHQIREERLHQQLRRQYDQMEEIRLQEQIKQNEIQLQRMNIRNNQWN